MIRPLNKIRLFKRRTVKTKDLTGLRAGRLRVLRREGSESYNKGHSLWQCVCDCGAHCVVTSINLKSGNTKSCGCYAREQREKSFLQQASKDTKPEMLFKRELARRGIDFVSQFPIKNGKKCYEKGFRETLYGDIKLEGSFLSDVIIEVDGCYYHNCVECGHAEKFPGKTEEDFKRTQYIESLGYRVFHVWEHEVIKDAKACVDVLLNKH